MYLITPESFSALHRLAFDEMFHFYLGDPCRSVMITPNGQVSEAILGQDIGAGIKVQHLVPTGYWQATTLIETGSWALLGTTMSPGFHESGFELATPNDVRHLAQGRRADILDLIAEKDEDQANLRQKS